MTNPLIKTADLVYTVPWTFNTEAKMFTDFLKSGLLFSDIPFIFRILPLFLLIYYLVPRKARVWISIPFSLLFYVKNAGEYTLVLLLALLLNFGLSFLTARKSRVALGFTIVLNACLLMGFKILSALGFTIHLPQGREFVILLPLGISFYTFKLISYQIDLYRQKYPVASFGSFAAYITDFTQVICGPIARYNEWKIDYDSMPTVRGFKNRVKEAFIQISEGLTFFITGLFFKVFIADHLSILWNSFGTIGYMNLSVPMAWLGVFVYSLNLFYDFWGYSLMASGIGVMMGHKHIRNFKDPYGATSVSDFYRRWHITLGTWFRDYIYIPMGGSRKGSFRTAFNLIVVWLLTGIWHGITPNFMIWAGALLLLILWEKFVLSKNKVVLRIFGQFHVLVLIPLTWVVFALPKFTDLSHYFLRLFGQSIEGSVINAKDYLNILRDGWIFLFLAVFCLIPGVRDFLEREKYRVFTTILLFVLFWISIFSASGASLNPFMYMNF